MAGEMERYLSRVGGSRTRDVADWAAWHVPLGRVRRTCLIVTLIISILGLNNTTTTSQPGEVINVFSVYLALSPHPMVRSVF
jgi:hypothetical protein